ncbi:MAG: hypothetical protein PUD09_03920 [Coriobacteriales bacterium]|nr:hypothetical protein [Coriobacteriales bacterium]
MAQGDFNRKMSDWMRGRNGVDELTTCSLWLALIFIVINIFARNMVVSLVAIAFLAYAWFRMSSKKLSDRADENQHFLSIVGPLGGWLRDPKGAWTEARTYKHFQCPTCGQKVRVPRGKGNVRVTCPKCHTKFDAKA